MLNPTSAAFKKVTPNVLLGTFIAEALEGLKGAWLPAMHRPMLMEMFL